MRRGIPACVVRGLLCAVHFQECSLSAADRGPNWKNITSCGSTRAVTRCLSDAAGMPQVTQVINPQVAFLSGDRSICVATSPDVG